MGHEKNTDKVNSFVHACSKMYARRHVHLRCAGGIVHCIKCACARTCREISQLTAEQHTLGHVACAVDCMRRAAHKCGSSSRSVCVRLSVYIQNYKSVLFSFFQRSCLGSVPDRPISDGSVRDRPFSDGSVRDRPQAAS